MGKPRLLQSSTIARNLPHNQLYLYIFSMYIFTFMYTWFWRQEDSRHIDNHRCIRVDNLKILWSVYTKWGPLVVSWYTNLLKLCSWETQQFSASYVRQLGYRKRGCFLISDVGLELLESAVPVVSVSGYILLLRGLYPNLQGFNYHAYTYYISHAYSSVYPHYTTTIVD